MDNVEIKYINIEYFTDNISKYLKNNSFQSVDGKISRVDGLFSTSQVIVSGINKFAGKGRFVKDGFECSKDFELQIEISETCIDYTSLKILIKD